MIPAPNMQMCVSQYATNIEQQSLRSLRTFSLFLHDTEVEVTSWSSDLTVVISAGIYTAVQLPAFAWAGIGSPDTMHPFRVVVGKADVPCGVWAQAINCSHAHTAYNKGQW